MIRSLAVVTSATMCSGLNLRTSLVRRSRSSSGKLGSFTRVCSPVGPALMAFRAAWYCWSKRRVIWVLRASASKESCAPSLPAFVPGSAAYFAHKSLDNVGEVDPCVEVVSKNASDRRHQARGHVGEEFVILAVETEIWGNHGH